MSHAPFSEFIRSGGNGEFRLSLLTKQNIAYQTKQLRIDVKPYVVDFRAALEALVAANDEMMQESFHKLSDGDGVALPVADHLIDKYVQDFNHNIRAEYQSRWLAQRASETLLAEFESVVQGYSRRLSQQFRNELNERRQHAMGITHYVWRSRDDSKVRGAHAERDDRVFAWSHSFSDGHPGNAFNCRCYAEPAVLGNGTIINPQPIQNGIESRLAKATERGLARAGIDATTGTVMGTYSTGRAVYLGYRRLFGIITPEEDAERLVMRDQVFSAINTLVNLDLETIKEIAQEFVQYHSAKHTDLRLLELEYRLGLASESALLKAQEEVAYLDGSILLGGTAFAGATAKSGVNLARMKPRDSLLRLRDLRHRLSENITSRKALADRIIDKRFRELEAQGHGPQRHEGAVTRQMLEDRVLRGIDPMTSTTTDGVTGRQHTQVRSATRITSPRAYVAAESYIRRSSEYFAARDAALFDPKYRRGTFTVKLPIHDVLGAGFQQNVEGVLRIGSPKYPKGVENIEFNDGLIIAVFRINSTGEPDLVTMFPRGR